jgi:hypothetical protein
MDKKVKPGQRYGTLVVIEYVGKVPGDGNRSARAWRCRCDCGRIEIVFQGRLTGGTSRRCIKCWRKKIQELGISENGLLPGGSIPRRIGIDTIDRRTWKGFFAYFQQAQHHFTETFGRVFTETAALEEWRKLFPRNQITGE